ncbi:secretory carrier-associated membrane protein 3-like isoform X1 [Hibiscus syriacus]|uniref:secretory carrier-associated membrane protein 3-like isoform X1 n=1 Tax=Hibiscus syriacus TaxID=106335 RepID=UPI001920C13A|nr:secretory carrier-associated membrane protein 3-like isoform X1 [Hibiscus syriacus]
MVKIQTQQRFPEQPSMLRSQAWWLKSQDPAVRGKASGQSKFRGLFSKNVPSAPPTSNSRLSPLPPEPAGFNYGREAAIDIPLDTASGGSSQDLKKKENELQAKEAELNRRE